MAARFFIPTSGEYAWTGSVWAATATGAAGSAATPVDGDDVYILNGTARITSALDQSAIQLNSLTIGFDGEIGTSAASLQIGLDASDPAWISGACTVNMVLTHTSASTLSILDGFSGNVNLTGSTLTNIYCGRSGGLNISGTNTITQIQTAGCSVSIAAGVSGMSSTELICYGGNHRSLSSMSAVSCIGGATFTLYGAGLTCGLASAYGRSRYIHDSSGTLANAVVDATSQITTSGRFGGFTVTSSIIIAGGRMFQQPPVPITYTNTTTKIGFR